MDVDDPKHQMTGEISDLAYANTYHAMDVSQMIYRLGLRIVHWGSRLLKSSWM